MQRGKVNVLCVQETRWKRSKTKIIVAGFKLYYDTVRMSDRVMNVKLQIEGAIMNIVSGYSPQVGFEMEGKEIL